MNKTLNFKTFKTFLQLLLLVVSVFGFSQTPGLIIRDGANNIPPSPLNRSTVLDPNQDGYTSATIGGFTTTDLGTASEINYQPISLIFQEPFGDLSRGPSGGFSDLVPDANGRSFYAFSNGTNIYFRLRIGNIVAGAKGYSALIDTDGKFGPEDPTYTASNPGYEYEISVQTGFKISIYDVNSGTACTEIWTRDLATNPQFVQTSIAQTTNNGNPDYFIDFYVPYSGFTGTTPLTTSTPLRFQPGTVMAPSSSLCGPTSDAYPGNNVSQQPQCTPDQIANGTCSSLPCTNPPSVTSPLSVGATNITGSWTKATYSTVTTARIEIYKNNVLIGTTTANSGSSWSFTTTALAANDVIYARASTSDASNCYKSNEVRVNASTCTPASTSSCPTVTCYTNTGIVGTGVAGATIKIKLMRDDGTITDVPNTNIIVDSSGNWIYYGSSNSGNANAPCTTGNSDIASGSYVITQTESGKCESGVCRIYRIGCTTTTANPTISNNFITINTTSINGTAALGSRVRLYLNGNQILTTLANSTTGQYSFDISTTYPQVGDIFAINAQSPTINPQSSTICTSDFVTKTVVCNITAPYISNTSNNITAGQSISGTSGYIGDTITIRNNSNDALIGTTTVSSNGTWTLATPTAVAGTTYYATVTTSCGVSTKSNIVTAIAATNSGRCGTINSPVNDNATTVTGTLGTAVSTTTVYLYLDDFLIGQTTTTTTSWSISVNTNATNKLYGGGVLKIGIKENTNAEVLCSNAVTIACSAPATPAISPTIYNVVEGGTKNIIVTNSSSGVLYTLETTTGIDASTSYFGNGGSLTITSAPISSTNGNSYKVTAINLSAPACNAQTAITINVASDSDGDGVPDVDDLDDDNDGILDATEGLCNISSTSSIDGFDSPVVPTINGNNIQTTNPYNGWSTETGGVTDFNVIRVNGAGYASGPDNAQSGTQYIDIAGTSAYVYKNITLTSPAVFSASAWFANRESSNGGYAPWSTKIEIRNETTGITVAQGNTINFTSSISDEIWNNSSINSVALPAGTYRIRMFVGDFGHLDSISYCFSKDTDGDGTPDHLDLDSDNDGCADALEGDENVTAAQLTSNRISGTVDANGVPNLVNAGGAADIGGDQGQGIGEAYNAAIQSGCFCYKPAQTTGTALDTNHGITALGRAGADNSNWPMVRKGAWTVLEAKTKGFVVNRLTDAQISAIPSADLREGMMVYNITQDCLQINIDGTATGWKCFNTQTCPDL